jgi:peptide/nickel transport system permease protein
MTTGRVHRVPLRRTSWKVWWSSLRQSARRGWALFRQDPIGLVGLALLTLFALMAMAYPILMASVWNPRIYEPLVGFDDRVFPHPTTPSLSHLLGTDYLGRDVLSQLLYSAGVAFGVGLLAAVLAAAVSTLVGATAAYYGGIVDAVLMQVADVVMVLPPFVALILLGMAFRLKLAHAAIVYGALSGLGVQAVVVKSHALTLRVKPYIDAARVAGGGSAHIILTHLLPGLLPLAFLNMMFTITGAVMAEAVLSFFGRTKILMSWGMMIYAAQVQSFTPEVQWQVLLPAGLAITLFCSAFYMVGRALEEMLNPRLRKL